MKTDADWHDGAGLALETRSSAMNAAKNVVKKR